MQQSRVYYMKKFIQSNLFDFTQCACISCGRLMFGISLHICHHFLFFSSVFFVSSFLGQAKQLGDSSFLFHPIKRTTSHASLYWVPPSSSTLRKNRILLSLDFSISFDHCEKNHEKRYNKCVVLNYSKHYFHNHKYQGV